MSVDPQQPQELSSGSPPAMQLVYANAVGARGGPFDLALEFGYLVPPSEGEEANPPIGLIRIAMSREHAKAMLELLQEQLRTYEEKVGPIPNIAALKVGDKE